MNTKEHVLALLESERGRDISGEYIAKRLGISRNAVWKAVRELEKDGYKIGAATNRGYCLREDNNILSVQGMLPFLPREYNSISIYDSLESTNKTAKEAAISGAAHGAVIIADSQTAGRGRYGRTFHSPPGHGIYMSFILRPELLRFETPTLITALIAVAVCEAIESVSEETPLIKWVNDIFINGKKVCGILTEAVTDLESGGIQWIVAGAGINVAAPPGGFPEELRHTAGAVFNGGVPPGVRNRLAAGVIKRMTAPPCRSDEILEKYKKRVFILGKRITVAGPGGPYEALAVDIDGAGRLIVKKDSGETLPLSSGEISIRDYLPQALSP